MRITFVPALAQTIATFIHLSLLYYFVFMVNLDVKGIGLATSITHLFKFLFTFGYVYCSRKISKALSWPRMNETFSNWKEYLKLSIPIIVILCSEWWACELITILAGMIGVREQATYIIVLTVESTIFEVPLATGEASCALIGNCIGANIVQLAKRFFQMTWIINLC